MCEPVDADPILTTWGCGNTIEDIGEIDQVVGQWCLNRVPPDLKKSVDYDYEIDGHAVIIIEVRPAWHGSPGEVTRQPMAKFRFVKATEQWQIYWMRASGKWKKMSPCSRPMNSMTP